MVQMRIEGGPQLAAALNSLSTRLSRRIQREALQAGGALIAERSKELAPRGDPSTPNLADEIVISNARPRDGSVGIAIGPTKSVFYGSFQEFGTAHHAAQPFMRPAFDGEAGRALKTISSAMWDSLIRRGAGSTRGSGGGVGL